ncbi:YphA family membrane protein [Virgibacillus salexigens]|uniref:Integral membrane protein n=2 Tax=Virgibacillus massiliensis TaxID=1462526 RepID=A0A024QCW4_9BACI|nr:MULTISPECIES: hypothetical protein [Virgibacillus]MYL41961.1 hypothetical protein [Virgibacillus massiliensis]CDQ39791.1 hypothetical protein BN990_02105 [Virgibacillus massiliensis]
MSSGLLFYWFSWMLWIIIVFMMKKNQMRSYLSFAILIIIISANVILSFQIYTVSLSYLGLVITAVLWMIQLQHLAYLLFASFTLSIGYAGILLWEKNAPVWIIMPRVILISFAIILLIVLCTKYTKERFAICLTGLTFGELMYSLTMSSYGFPEIIGDLQFFDILLFVIVIILILDILQRGRNKWIYYKKSMH